MVSLDLAFYQGSTKLMNPIQQILRGSIARFAFALILIVTLLNQVSLKAQSNQHFQDKILFVVTSNDIKGSTGEPSGFYLSEVSHPWEVLTKAGYDIDFVSPKGGKAPVDALILDDAINNNSGKIRFTERK
jgi:hypothetical protein